MNLGIIELPKIEILRWLDLEGGDIIRADMPVEKDIVRLLVKHDSFPFLSEGYQIPVVSLTYTNYTGCKYGNLVKE